MRAPCDAVDASEASARVKRACRSPPRTRYAATRNPMFEAALSGVLACRADNLYRLQYESWQR